VLTECDVSILKTITKCKLPSHYSTVSIIYLWRWIEIIFYLIPRSTSWNKNRRNIFKSCCINSLMFFLWLKLFLVKMFFSPNSNQVCKQPFFLAPFAPQHPQKPEGPQNYNITRYLPSSKIFQSGKVISRRNQTLWSERLSILSTNMINSHITHS
jgi:hypothetical protein